MGGRRWTAEEDRILRGFVAWARAHGGGPDTGGRPRRGAGSTYSNVAHIIDRTEPAVRQRARALGIGIRGASDEGGRQASSQARGRGRMGDVEAAEEILHE